jgi:hypothetical protein
MQKNIEENIDLCSSHPLDYQLNEQYRILPARLRVGSVYMIMAALKASPDDQIVVSLPALIKKKAGHHALTGLSGVEFSFLDGSFNEPRDTVGALFKNGIWQTHSETPPRIANLAVESGFFSAIDKDINAQYYHLIRAYNDIN